MEQLHVLLAVGIMAAYTALPFTSLRGVPVTTATRVFGMLFLGTCALAHLALAAGFYNSVWITVNELVQLVAILGFTYTLCRQVSWALRRRKQLSCERAHERGGEAATG